MHTLPLDVQLREELGTLVRMPSDEVALTLEDLRWLRETLADGWETSDADARRMSAVLRRLLIEGEVGRSWRALGFASEPTVRAANLRRLVAGYPYQAVEIAIAGASHLKVCRGVGSMIEASHTLTMSKELVLRRGQADVDLRLTAWLDSPGILTRGTFVDRRVVVKYVANLLGGVHFGGDKKSKDRPWFRVLDNLPEGRTVFGRTPNTLKQPVFAEVVAIAQTIAFSQDARQMAEAAEKTSSASAP